MKLLEEIAAVRSEIGKTEWGSFFVSINLETPVPLKDALSCQTEKRSTDSR